MMELSTAVSSKISDLAQELDIVANNLANVSTVGFKRRINCFSQSLSAQQAGSESAEQSTSELTTVFDFSQGSMNRTERPLDLALCGKGIFVIETPEGLRYSRNGMFRLNQNNQIVDLSGRFVSGQAGPITVPPNVGPSQINVNSDGSISAAGASIGRFRVVDFGEDEGKLISAGANCFRAPEDLKPNEAANVVVRQGYQEASNVKLVEELVNMVMVTRLYESNMKFLDARRDTAKSLIGLATS